MNWGRVIIYVVLAIAFVIVTYLVFRPPHESVCRSLLPQEASTGLNIAGSSAKVDIGAVQKSSGATPEQAASFITCLRQNYTDVQVSNGVIIPRKPAGELANDWSGQSGLQLSVEPQPGAGEEQNKILQNVGIGPAAGTKAAVVANWCRAAQACITCEPQDIGDATNQVIVRVRPDAQWEKRQMAGSYPPAPQNPHKPWEDVNEKGERFYYECKGAGASR